MSAPLHTNNWNKRKEEEARGADDDVSTCERVTDFLDRSFQDSELKVVSVVQLVWRAATCHMSEPHTAPGFQVRCRLCLTDPHLDLKGARPLFSLCCCFVSWVLFSSLNTCDTRVQKHITCHRETGRETITVFPLSLSLAADLKAAESLRKTIINARLHHHHHHHRRQPPHRVQVLTALFGPGEVDQFVSCTAPDTDGCSELNPQQKRRTGSTPVYDQQTASISHQLASPHFGQFCTWVMFRNVTDLDPFSLFITRCENPLRHRQRCSDMCRTDEAVNSSLQTSSQTISSTQLLLDVSGDGGADGAELQSTLTLTRTHQQCESHLPLTTAGLDQRKPAHKCLIII